MTVKCEKHNACISVPNVLDAVKVYTTKLGFTEGFFFGDPPVFAGINFDRVEIFLSSNQWPSGRGSSVFFVVGDVDHLYEFHRTNGVEIAQEIDDREFGMRDYVARDPYGNSLVFGAPLLTR